MSGVLFRLIYEGKQIPLKTAFKCLSSIYKLDLSKRYLYTCDYYKTKYYVIDKKCKKYHKFCREPAKYKIEICIFKKRPHYYEAYLCPVHVKYFKRKYEKEEII